MPKSREALLHSLSVSRGTGLLLPWRENGVQAIEGEESKTGLFMGF